MKYTGPRKVLYRQARATADGIHSWLVVRRRPRARQLYIRGEKQYKYKYSKMMSRPQIAVFEALGYSTMQSW